MVKGTFIINRPKVYKQIAGLRRAGKTENEIAKILGLTPATINYVVSFNLPAQTSAINNGDKQSDQRPRLAYEMRQSGKSFAEIGKKLQISTSGARRMVHRYGWLLRHPRERDTIEY
jgi:predicted transcriptional regulator